MSEPEDDADAVEQPITPLECLDQSVEGDNRAMEQHRAALESAASLRTIYD